MCTISSRWRRRDRDAAEAANGRGVRPARLHAIETEILGSLNRNDLSLPLPAKRVRGVKDSEVIFCAAGVLSAAPLAYSLRRWRLRGVLLWPAGRRGGLCAVISNMTRESSTVFMSIGAPSHIDHQGSQNALSLCSDMALTPPLPSSVLASL
jgi:hypothetical protein